MVKALGTVGALDPEPESGRHAPILSRKTEQDAKDVDETAQ
jgi:hypothetical protein